MVTVVSKYFITCDIQSSLVGIDLNMIYFLHNSEHQCMDEWLAMVTHVWRENPKEIRAWNFFFVGRETIRLKMYQQPNDENKVKSIFFICFCHDTNWAQKMNSV